MGLLAWLRRRREKAVEQAALPEPPDQQPPVPVERHPAGNAE